MASTKKWVAYAIDTNTYKRLGKVEVCASNTECAHTIGREKLYARLGKWGWTCVLESVAETRGERK